MVPAVMSKLEGHCCASQSVSLNIFPVSVCFFPSGTLASSYSVPKHAWKGRLEALKWYEYGVYVSYDER